MPPKSSSAPHRTPVDNTFTAEAWIRRSSTTKSVEIMNKGFQITDHGDEQLERQPGLAATSPTSRRSRARSRASVPATTTTSS
jgi:hypothetical protein